MRIFKILLLILSLLSAAYTVSPAAGVLSLVFMIPLFYGVLYYFLVPDTMLPGPGFATMNFVFFIRYILLPPIFKYYGFQMDFINENEYVLRAICISIIEIVIVLLTIRFSANQKVTYVPIEARLIHKRIPLILCFVAIVAFVFNPEALANIHFILNPEMIIANKTVLSSNVWFKIIEWAQLFIILFLVSLLYSRYRSVWLVIVVSMIPCLFYFGHSRLSLLLPLITTMFLIIKLFPGRRKMIIIIFASLALFAMGSLTIVKQFRVDSISEISGIQLADLLGSYFGGLPNIVTGLSANDFFTDKIGLNTIINDMFRNSMGFSSLFSSNDNSVYYFNHVFYGYGYDQIIPTVCQGVFYFGYFFFWIPTLIMVKLILYSDSVYFSSSKIEYVWAFSFFSIAIGWAVPGSFQHVYINFHNFLLPILILGFLNRMNVVKYLKIIILILSNIQRNGSKKIIVTWN